MRNIGVARNLRLQAPGRRNRSAIAADTPNLPVPSALQDEQETADQYARVVAHLCDLWRVVECKDRCQWIIQRRKKGGAERPWRGKGYFRTRAALLRACASFCGRIDPAALALLLTLPEHFGRSA